MDKYIVEKAISTGTETIAQAQLRDCLLGIFAEEDTVSTIRVAGELIEYSRLVLTAMGAIRRSAAAHARSTMTPDEIAKATNLSRATVSRLITEYRNVPK